LCPLVAATCVVFLFRFLVFFSALGRDTVTLHCLRKKKLRYASCRDSRTRETNSSRSSWSRQNFVKHGVCENCSVKLFHVFREFLENNRKSSPIIPTRLLKCLSDFSYIRFRFTWHFWSFSKPTYKNIYFIFILSIKVFFDGK
jgi:hypothetical protein